MGNNPEIIGDDKYQKVILATPSSGDPLSVQYPLPTDGDSIHAKDVDIDNSILGDFSGAATDFFDDLHSANINNTATNPKLLTIHFNRTVVSQLIGLGSSAGGNFSNVKLYAIVSGGIEIVIADNSLDNTKKTTQFFQFPNTGFNAFRLEFHTIDAVSLTNIYMPKVVSVAATIETSTKYATSYKSPYLLSGASQAMNVDGSITPVDFKYTVSGLSTAKWVRSFVDLQDGAQNFSPDDFGAIAGGITNGVDIIVVKDGVEYILENWKTNMDISMTMFDFNSPFKVGAYIGRWTITSDIGSPITLFPDDEIILRVNDNLLALDAFRLRVKISQ